MNKQQFSEILTNLAEKEFPSRENPWDMIRSKIIRNQQGLHKPSQTIIQGQHRLNYGTLVVLAIITLLAGFLVTPVGQAFAARIAQFFIPVGEGSLSQVASTPTAPLLLVNVDFKYQQISNPAEIDTGLCDAQINPQCSFAIAQEQVEFPLQQFGILPAGLYFKGAAVERNRVTAQYQCPSGCDIWLEQEKLNGIPPEPAPVGSDASIEQAQIGSATGEYVQGTYTGDSGVWESNANVYFLRWQQEDVLYTISVVLTESSETVTFQPSHETLVTLAEGLTTDLSLTQPLNPAYLTSIQDAQTLSGIRVVEPSWLPDGYTFSFATYDKTTQFVCLNYVYNNASYPSLFIRESVTAPVSQLQAASASELTSEMVNIGETHEEARYFTGFAAPAGVCGEQEALFRAGEALLWRTPERTFELYSELPSPYGSVGLDQKELLTLAASLLDGTPPVESGVDVGHLVSIPVAEQYVGYSIKTPTKLPAGSTFEYAADLNGSVRSLYGGSAGNLPSLMLYQCPSIAQDSPCLDLLNEIPIEFRENVEMSGDSAVYAAGSPGKTKAESTETWHSQDPAITERLYWQMDGWNYVLMSTGVVVERDMLIVIAESLE